MGFIDYVVEYFRGPAGADGAPGSNGQDGAPGAQGEQGAPGPQGEYVMVAQLAEDLPGGEWVEFSVEGPVGSQPVSASWSNLLSGQIKESIPGSTFNSVWQFQFLNNPSPEGGGNPSGGDAVNLQALFWVAAN